MEIFTVGHSTHEKEKLIDMLQFNNIDILADVRSIPFSRRYPHFNQYRLEDINIDGNGSGFNPLFIKIKLSIDKGFRM